MLDAIQSVATMSPIARRGVRLNRQDRGRQDLSSDGEVMDELLEPFLRGFAGVSVPRNLALSIGVAAGFGGSLLREIEEASGLELPARAGTSVAAIGAFAALLPAAGEFGVLDEMLSPATQAAIETTMSSTGAPGPWSLVPATPTSGLSEMSVKIKDVLTSAGHPVPDADLAAFPTKLAAGAHMAQVLAEAWRTGGEDELPPIMREFANYLQAEASAGRSPSVFYDSEGRPYTVANGEPAWLPIYEAPDGRRFTTWDGKSIWLEDQTMGGPESEQAPAGEQIGGGARQDSGLRRQERKPERDFGRQSQAVDGFDEEAIVHSAAGGTFLLMSEAGPVIERSVKSLLTRREQRQLERSDARTALTVELTNLLLHLFSRTWLQEYGAQTRDQLMNRLVSEVDRRFGEDVSDAHRRATSKMGLAERYERMEAFYAQFRSVSPEPNGEDDQRSVAWQASGRFAASMGLEGVQEQMAIPLLLQVPIALFGGVQELTSSGTS
jgi:hypothetical protein